MTILRIKKDAHPAVTRGRVPAVPKHQHKLPSTCFVIVLCMSVTVMVMTMTVTMSSTSLNAAQPARPILQGTVPKPSRLLLLGIPALHTPSLCSLSLQAPPHPTTSPTDEVTSFLQMLTHTPTRTVRPEGWRNPQDGKYRGRRR